jgi:hypothetical protein
VAAVTVNLYRGDGSQVASTQTAADGKYGFSSLAAGQYQLEFLPAARYRSSPANVSADDRLDSDAHSSTGRTVIFDLAAGVNLVGWDAGVFDGAIVQGRSVFYNQSKFDGNDAAANAADDAAIAVDKLALLPGQASSIVNYTSYNRGINGVMIDIAGLPTTSLLPSDFEFKVGNSSTPAEWAPLPTSPNVSVRPAAGIAGSSRVSLTWPSGQGAIKQWLQVTVKANANTGLVAPDVFYFGNAVGESGNVPGDYSVSLADELLARNNAVSIMPGANITTRYDYNRDGTVSVIDQLLSRNNITTATSKLKQITVPASVTITELSAQTLSDARLSIAQPIVASSFERATDQAPTTVDPSGDTARRPRLQPQAISAAYASSESAPTRRRPDPFANDGIDADLLELLCRKR